MSLSERLRNLLPSDVLLEVEEVAQLEQEVISLKEELERERAVNLRADGEFTHSARCARTVGFLDNEIHLRQATEKALGDTAAERDAALEEVTRLHDIVAEFLNEPKGTISTALMAENEVQKLYQERDTAIDDLKMVQETLGAQINQLVARITEANETIVELKAELACIKDAEQPIPCYGGPLVFTGKG